MSSGNINRPYLPLCLLASPRSGTNLLRYTLNAHPDVLIHGEVFNQDLRPRAYALAWRHKPPVLFEGGPVVPYLRAHVWPREDEGKKVVGFKFFPFHGQWLPSEPRMEDAIARFRNIRVLRIIRENLLDVMISHLMAKRDCSWISLKPGTRQEPLAIPYEVCVSWLVGLEREREEATRRFARFPMLTITYNEVAYHNVRCMKSVQAWLGVEARVLKPQFPPHKQRIIPRHEAILDFEGLRAQIARTHPQWLRFFDEPEPFIGADHSASAHATATMP